MTKSTRRRLVAGAMATAVLSLGMTGTANAVPSSGHRATTHARQISRQKVSVQLFNFFVYIGTDATAESRARQEEVLSRLSAMGYQNVEPVDYTGFQGLTAVQYRALLTKYGLKASALHTSVSMTTTDAEWKTILTTAKTIGAPYVGAGSDPRTFTTAAEWVAYAKKIDHLGALARRQGLRYMVHSHDFEFTSVYDGRTAYDILQKYTHPQNVVFELDLYWATKADAHPIDLLRRYGDRIKLLHVKDMATDGSITTVGEGTIDFPRLFAAAGCDIRYYVIERDPPFDGSTFDPFEPAAKGLAYLSTVRF